ncbi:amino acid permease [Paenibacillus profundus]|uniref:Amino acid permease n=1 Tax=Paenibacillus profundus TaxID=1173085 RepID=A0ABS8YJ85_9BACL|nr:amino acid permease [Paenibacillus profundus]MCE5170391.1 amino acid permease [Paenibacillus profundus]
MNRSDESKKLRWYNIALMAFVSVWGFGNVVNNYANQGLTVITSWVLIIALYFVPYALMVGQLGSTFKDGKGGVSSWIKETMGPTIAYFAAWTYWVVHVPYLAQKPQSSLAFSIDAPLKMLLLDADAKFVPKSLLKTNDRNTPINGYIMTAVLVGILIVIPALGIGNMNSLFNWLLDLNSIVMPLRYLFVFAAFMALMKLADKFQSDYQFVKNRKVGFAIGLWCFVFTAFACIMGMFPKVETFTGEWYFQFALNILTPFILLGLGLILPLVARWSNKQ